MSETTTAPANNPLSNDEALIEAYQTMLLIRFFENEVQRQFLAGNALGTSHLCNGQEAICVGVAAVLEDGDQVAATYRSHGHALARGVSPRSLMAELMGRSAGINGGRGGGMNVIARDRGLLGCYGIIGGSIAAATGAALSARRGESVAVAFFGDATCNQAYFPECINFAKVLDLPLLLVCENNLYGEYTAIERSTAGDLCERAASYGVPSVKVDGNDVLAVGEATAAAVERARSRGGPTFLECLTYRHLGHSKADPGTYRPKEEVEQWKAKDPIPATRRLLAEERATATDRLDELEREVEQTVADAVEAALASDYPDPTMKLTEYADAT